MFEMEDIFKVTEDSVDGLFEQMKGFKWSGRVCGEILAMFD